MDAVGDTGAVRGTGPSVVVRAGAAGEAGAPGDDDDGITDTTECVEDGGTATKTRVVGTDATPAVLWGEAVSWRGVETDTVETDDTEGAGVTEDDAVWTGTEADTAGETGAEAGESVGTTGGAVGATGGAARTKAD